MAKVNHLGEEKFKKKKKNKKTKREKNGGRKET